MRLISTFTLLLASLLLVAPPALADEQKADCEQGQRWITYDEDFDRLMRVVTLGLIHVCEGEHWDGQDSVEPAWDPGSTVPCANTTGTIPTRFTASNCMGPDPNQNSANVLALKPVTARVTERVANEKVEVYASNDIDFVLRSAVYVGVCTNTGPGLEGVGQCSLGRARIGVYYRDNVPANLVYHLWSSLGIDRGETAEADCSQAQYQEAATSGDRSKCRRDNTAITIEILP